jgi:acetylornithine/succinyldiaminopimelate/putrescine aminotransferase
LREKVLPFAARCFLDDVCRIIGVTDVDLRVDAAPVVTAALERRVLVNRTAETVIRLLPPLVINEAEAAEALDRLDAALAAVSVTGGHAA